MLEEPKVGGKRKIKKIGVVGAFRYDQYMSNAFKRMGCEIVYIPPVLLRVGAYEKVRELLDCDILWTNVPYMEGLTAGMLREIFGIPFVLSLEGYPWLQHQQYQKSGIADASLQDISELAFHFADRIVSYPNCCLGRFADRYPQYEGKTVCVPYGCRFEGVPVSERVRKQGDPIRLLHVSNVEMYEKFDGTCMVIDMMAHLKGEVTLTVAVSGDGRNQVLDYVASKRDTRIQYLGFVEDVAKLYQEHDIFVYATMLELMCYSLIEAMYFGLPVVVASEWNSPEGIKGMFVRASAVSLANAVTELIKNEVDRLRMAEQGQAFVRTHLNWDTIAANYMQVFQEVLDDRERLNEDPSASHHIGLELLGAGRTQGELQGIAVLLQKMLEEPDLAKKQAINIELNGLLNLPQKGTDAER